MGSSSSNKPQTDQLNLQNTLQQQQLAAENQQFQQIQSSLAPYLSGTQGFTPQQQALMNSQALDENASQYNGAGQQLRAALNARGENGANPVSGTGVSGIAGLLSGKASDAANALRSNSLANAQQALTNQFNANSILSGIGNTYAGNVGQFGSGASSALSNLTQQNIANQQNSFLANLSRGLGAGLGGGLGSAAGAGLSGGIGTALSTVGKGNFGWIWLLAMFLVPFSW